MKKSKVEGLSLDELAKKVKKEFVIRYRFYNKENISYVISAGEYYKIVTRKVALQHFRKVLTSKDENITFTIRMSLKIDFLQI